MTLTTGRSRRIRGWKRIVIIGEVGFYNWFEYNRTTRRRNKVLNKRTGSSTSGGNEAELGMEEERDCWRSLKNWFCSNLIWELIGESVQYLKIFTVLAGIGKLERNVCHRQVRTFVSVRIALKIHRPIGRTQFYIIILQIENDFIGKLIEEPQE